MSSAEGVQPAAGAARDGPAPTTAEMRAELEAVLGSRTFERAQRLREFLRFVCERALEGRSADINEYLIASEVFGRGPEYAEGEQAVVRRQAHALRGKLQRFYADEGAARAVRIDLPVGQYVPAFVRRPPPPPVEERGAGASVGVRRRRWLLAGGALVALAAALLAGRLVGGGQAAVDPAVLRIWGAWLRAPGPVVLALPNQRGMVVRSRPASPAAPSAPGLDGFVELTAPMDHRAREYFKVPADVALFAHPDNHLARIADAGAMVRFAAFLARLGQEVQPTYTALLNWEALRREKVVLVGPSDVNPWLDTVLEPYPLRVVVASGDRPARIVGAAARDGRAAEYLDSSFGPGWARREEQHALISMLPGTGGDRPLLVVHAAKSPAVEMAAAFLTSPELLRELVAALDAAGGAGAPWFQAVLRVDVRGKVPQRGRIVLALPVVAGARNRSVAVP